MVEIDEVQGEVEGSRYGSDGNLREFADVEKEKVKVYF